MFKVLNLVAIVCFGIAAGMAATGNSNAADVAIACIAAGLAWNTLAKE